MGEITIRQRQVELLDKGKLFNELIPAIQRVSR
jgi:hypothetical protein